MITYSGRNVWPPHMDMEPIGPSLEDIAVALGRQSRFAGHTEDFYTVLCHSHVCSNIGNPEFAIDKLLHDAGEAIVSDVPTTWKPQEIKDYEYEILSRIYKEHNLVWPVPDEARAEIDRCDFACLVAEAHVLGHIGAKQVWPLNSYPADMTELIVAAMDLTSHHLRAGHPISYLDPVQATYWFQTRFDELHPTL